MSILKLLRNEAKMWWYHSDLRRQGSAKKARTLEHESVRNTINRLRDTIKSKGYGSVGRGGYSLHYIPSPQGNLTYGKATLSGYGDINSPLMQVAIKLGIPVKDSTIIPDDRIIETLKFPMVGLQEIDSKPYNSLSYAPLSHVFNLYRELGAKIYNY